jgi:hypothetical protein
VRRPGPQLEHPPRQTASLVLVHWLYLVQVGDRAGKVVQRGSRVIPSECEYPKGSAEEPFVRAHLNPARSASYSCFH